VEKATELKLQQVALAVEVIAVVASDAVSRAVLARAEVRRLLPTKFIK